MHRAPESRFDRPQAGEARLRRATTSGPRRSLAAVIALLFVAGLGSAAAVAGQRVAADSGPVRVAPAPTERVADPAFAPQAAPPVPQTTIAAPPPVPHPTGPVPLAGCPPPPRPPSPPSTPWHPAVLVPETALPEPAPAAPRAAALDAAAGKGMWLWKWSSTENGNADAVVDKAVAAGLSQLWVRVGDSQDGFYGAGILDSLVAKAHDRGLSVIGWGFPYLYDPVADAQWTSDALAWRGRNGDQLDGFSPDLETASEGVMVTERRMQVYLGAVGQAAGDRPVIATVFRPTDSFWASYPYRAIAAYVDAFAAMVYWGCNEPGAAASEAIARLSTLKPVHVIGQGYNMGDEGGRQVSPSADETWRFLDVAHVGGAVGASFWSWQEITEQQWTAMAEFPWPGPPTRPRGRT